MSNRNSATQEIIQKNICRSMFESHALSKKKIYKSKISADFLFLANRRRTVFVLLQMIKRNIKTLYAHHENRIGIFYIYFVYTYKKIYTHAFSKWRRWSHMLFKTLNFVWMKIYSILFFIYHKKEQNICKFAWTFLFIFIISRTFVYDWNFCCCIFVESNMSLNCILLGDDTSTKVFQFSVNIFRLKQNINWFFT